MKKTNHEPMFQSGKEMNDEQKGYYGMDPEQNLQSVSFATTENEYLNEHFQEDPKDKNEHT